MSNTNFKKAEWIFTTDLYEVNLRQYTAEGTFNAFSNELLRLKNLGVTTLWFMPITPVAVKNRKGTMGSQYACSDYINVAPEYGTLEDFKNLVAKAHSMGFKVILDWVANHTGWDNVWTITHPEYYKFDHESNDFKKASGMYDIIELDYNNPAMRKAMIDAMLFWITACDIDGFRCDLAAWVTLDFWLEARTELEKTKTLFWLAECDPIENPSFYDAFDACYCWKWMHKTEEFYKGDQNKLLLDDLLKQYQELPYTDKLVLWFTSNHDENTWNGTEYEKYGDAADALAVFSFTWNGIPLIYSGQELPNLKRLEFFDKDTINWEGPHIKYDFYKTLLYLHKNSPALRGGDSTETHIVQTNAMDRVMVYLRKSGNSEVLVILNLSQYVIDCRLQDKIINGNFRNVFTNDQSVLNEESAFFMDPWKFLVLEKIPGNA